MWLSEPEGFEPMPTWIVLGQSRGCLKWFPGAGEITTLIDRDFNHEAKHPVSPCVAGPGLAR